MGDLAAARGAAGTGAAPGLAGAALRLLTLRTSEPALARSEETRAPRRVRAFRRARAPAPAGRALRRADADDAALRAMIEVLTLERVNRTVRLSL